MSYTLIIVIITAITSYLAFSNDQLYSKFILWPKKMDTPAEYYRLLSSGFIHADWMHLIFNMLALYLFGGYVESYFESLDKHFLFIVLYLGGVIAASLPSFIKHKHDSYYRSLGASGGVAAVLFSFVYFAPWEIIYIWFIPVPAIIAAVGYLIYSAYMSRKGVGAINHDAHFWGAVYGFLFTLLFDPTHGRIFFEQVTHPSFNF
ncbi:MAG: rhomboid family intrarane serine protease [Flavipsychrobacter sp.]|jgi:membrane associated rhomboid family serine protease|nr:rhomboid family intrarane serine protease [Flavipsychrobacter sp.]